MLSAQAEIDFIHQSFDDREAVAGRGPFPDPALAHEGAGGGAPDQGARDQEFQRGPRGPPAGCVRGHVGAQVARVHREPLHHGPAEGEAAGEEGKCKRTHK